jgi:hypothetical protein
MRQRVHSAWVGRVRPYWFKVKEGSVWHLIQAQHQLPACGKMNHKGFMIYAKKEEDDITCEECLLIYLLELMAE